MDKLNQLLSDNIRDFGAVFGSATDGWTDDAPAVGCPVWLEGWMAPAHAGYVLGDGEFVQKGEPHRFYFAGLPLRQGQRVRLSGAGTVTGLRTLQEFSGVYLPWEAAPALTDHGAETYLKNRHGVVIALTASEGGLVELPFDGLRVRLAADL